jgi:hypothetical protein
MANGENMHDINVILADLQGLGRVRLCECNSVHVSVGPVTINLEPAAFEQLSALMNIASEQLAKVRESTGREHGIGWTFRPLHNRMTH